MQPLTGIKASFCGGEFAPSLYSRIDLAKYAIGARTLRNFIVHPHGGISNRPGLEYIATEKTADKKIRLIPFEFSTTQTYVIELGDYYARFYTDGVQVYDDDSYDNYTKLMMHANASPFTDEVDKTIVSVEDPYTNTKLLIHFDGADGDQGDYTAETGQTVTTEGTAQLDTAQKVFGTASMLFDGDSDYCTVPDHADWHFGAGNFTIDFRAKINSLAADGTFVSQGTDGDNYWRLYARSNGSIELRHYVVDENTITCVSAAAVITTDTYYHIALVRNGTDYRIYVDGVSVANVTDSDDWADYTGPLSIGVLNYVAGQSTYFNGWIDEFRVSKGIARWTENFTKPASAYSLEPALDTTNKKWGAGSTAFSGGYLTVADNADWYFGANGFSIDFQVRFYDLAERQGLIGQYEDANNYWILGKDINDKLYMIFRIDGSYMAYYTTTSAVSIAINTWYHMEFTRSGANAYIFLDGVSQALTATTSFGSSDVGDVAGTLRIGFDEVNTAFLSGNLDEIRVSKGVARHTADFTAPIAAYTTGTIYEVVTPYAEDDLCDIQYTQSADVLYLTHPDYAPRQLERAGATNWSIPLYDYQNGPFQLANTDTADYLKISAVSGDDKTLTATGWTFNALHVGALFRLRHYIEGQAVTAALDAKNEVTSGVTCGGTWRLITHGTWTGTIRIEKSSTGAFGGEETMLREFSSADDFNANTYGTKDMSDYALPFYVRIKMTARASGICNVNLSGDPYYHEGIVKITAVAAGGATATADVIRTCGAITDTIDWSESSWSDYRGWPAIVEFHPEDRLVFGNTHTEPYTYWMTRTGSYLDFSRSSPLQDDDGISSPLPGRKVNGINGLIPLSEMIALTLSNEVSIRSTAGPLTPTTAWNKIHGWEGSYGVKPVVVGNRAIYVQSTGTIVRDLGFDLSQESFVGADLTIFSNHLFLRHIITEIAYQQNPDRIVWAIRDDGKLLSMTYMREQEVVAWSWHDTNDGTDLFESVCTIRGSGYDEVWVAVNRNGTRYIERMVQRMASTVLEDQFFVDCGTIYEAGPSLTVTGLTHLASKAVSVLADGVVVSGKTVSAAGVLTLDTAATIVQVGLGYKADVETLNVEVNLADGTAQGRKVHISNVVLRLLSTQGGYIGRDSSNLYPLNLESHSEYDAASLYSGDHGVSLGAGYAEGGRFFYRQSDPLPVTITGLVPQVTVGGSTNVR
ncbi:hypothetical protein D4R71_00315 [bacterium]|nr:MAG: hypothetical protein D4R71_00315 [bacterium]